MTTNSLDPLTTIPLRKPTRDRLKALGGKGETYDDILNRLIDIIETPLPRSNRTRQPDEPGLVDFETVD